MRPPSARRSRDPRCDLSRRNLSSSNQALHRTRQLLVRQRTMLSNAIRGHMAELGIISAKGRNGTAELLATIADKKDDRIPAAGRFSLEVLTRQYGVVAI